MRKLFPLMLCVLCALSASACGRMTGQFAYKMPDADCYRQMDDGMEFSSGVPVDWVFSFDRVSGRKNISVIVQKKEIVWADVTKDSRTAEKGSPYVHGTVSGLEPGEYRIVLSSGDTLIAEKPFSVYDPSDTGDDD